VKNSTKWHKTFVMDAWGDSEGSAMSRLVSQPVSLAVEAVLQGKLEAGVQAAPNDIKIVDNWLTKIDNLAQYLKVIHHN
jgi:saccharopine dehydrogenase (NADP+, L-glutamate forming)